MFLLTAVCYTGVFNREKIEYLSLSFMEPVVGCSLCPIRPFYFEENIFHFLVMDEKNLSHVGEMG